MTARIASRSDGSIPTTESTSYPPNPVKTPRESAISETFCNICGSDLELSVRGRDVPSCPACSSTPRTRAVIRCLSLVLFGEVLDLRDFPHRPDLAGLGMSDWGYDKGLSEKLSYRNTFYEKEPRLDITNIPSGLERTCDFLISSDVFEHVEPPVERAFEGAYRLLKPKGIFVLTVPYFANPNNEHEEHFPNLREWEIYDFNGSKILINRTEDGWEVFDDLYFHDGPGTVLEMRVFSRSELLRQLEAAGFADIVEHAELVDGCWDRDSSYPITACKP